ncbi:UPF0739 protein C1orf74 homolog [Stegostoma tigrinum]|uniref:UPF0739 protein C1orf74 homolog n=1 Tax=Stegostoma tigrinum TaxID=3053191 RepID=UPI00202B08B8|nr:UPF0739 protein C1orf74 homolog [Stegostoma tigrinum]XP_048409275.1 UPF0739 protein C1orf74 homolog [Stegostoma tigrinum]
METALKEQLIFAAQKTLRIKQKKNFSSSCCLNLFAEVLAVDLELKPTFLFDYSPAKAEQVQNYIQEVQKTRLLSQHLHILSIEENVLIINLNKAIRHLERTLQENRVPIIDVSADRSSPRVAETCISNQVKAQLDLILKHLKSQVVQRGRCESGVVSASKIFSSEWNLCTIFGFLLGFPISYWFDFNKTFENCLSMTELRVFSASAFCHRITKNLKHQMYSFSIPEVLYLELQSAVESWNRDLQSDFTKQSNFSELSFSTEITCQPAITL